MTLFLADGQASFRSNNAAKPCSWRQPQAGLRIAIVRRRSELSLSRELPIRVLRAADQRGTLDLNESSTVVPTDSDDASNSIPVFCRQGFLASDSLCR